MDKVEKRKARHIHRDRQTDRRAELRLPVRVRLKMTNASNAGLRMQGGRGGRPGRPLT